MVRQPQNWRERPGRNPPQEAKRLRERFASVSRGIERRRTRRRRDGAREAERTGHRRGSLFAWGAIGLLAFFVAFVALT